MTDVQLSVGRSSMSGSTRSSWYKDYYKETVKVTQRTESFLDDDVDDVFIITKHSEPVFQNGEAEKSDRSLSFTEASKDLKEDAVQKTNKTKEVARSNMLEQDSRLPYYGRSISVGMHYEEYRPPKLYVKPDTKLRGKSETTYITGCSPNKCRKCGMTVYEMEKVLADHSAYHKSCFRCVKCQQLLSSQSYVMIEGMPFCSSHRDLLQNRSSSYSGESFKIQSTAIDQTKKRFVRSTSVPSYAELSSIKPNRPVVGRLMKINNRPPLDSVIEHDEIEKPTNDVGDMTNGISETAYGDENDHIVQAFKKFQRMDSEIPQQISPNQSTSTSAALKSLPEQNCDKYEVLNLNVTSEDLNADSNILVEQPHLTNKHPEVRGSVIPAAESALAVTPVSDLKVSASAPSTQTQNFIADSLELISAQDKVSDSKGVEQKYASLDSTATIEAPESLEGNSAGETPTDKPREKLTHDDTCIVTQMINNDEDEMISIANAFAKFRQLDQLPDNKTKHLTLQKQENTYKSVKSKASLASTPSIQTQSDKAYYLEASTFPNKMDENNNTELMMNESGSDENNNNSRKTFQHDKEEIEVEPQVKDLKTVNGLTEPLSTRSERINEEDEKLQERVTNTQNEERFVTLKHDRKIDVKIEQNNESITLTNHPEYEKQAENKDSKKHANQKEMEINSSLNRPVVEDRIDALHENKFFIASSDNFIATQQDEYNNITVTKIMSLNSIDKETKEKPLSPKNSVSEITAKTSAQTSTTQKSTNTSKDDYPSIRFTQNLLPIWKQREEYHLLAEERSSETRKIITSKDSTDNNQVQNETLMLESVETTTAVKIVKNPASSNQGLQKETVQDLKVKAEEKDVNVDNKTVVREAEQRAILHSVPERPVNGIKDEERSEITTDKLLVNQTVETSLLFTDTISEQFSLPSDIFIAAEYGPMIYDDARGNVLDHPNLHRNNLESSFPEYKIYAKEINASQNREVKDHQNQNELHNGYQVKEKDLQVSKIQSEKVQQPENQPRQLQMRRYSTDEVQRPKNSLRADFTRRRLAQFKEMEDKAQAESQTLPSASKKVYKWQVRDAPQLHRSSQNHDLSLNHYERSAEIPSLENSPREALDSRVEARGISSEYMQSILKQFRAMEESSAPVSVPTKSAPPVGPVNRVTSLGSAKPLYESGVIDNEQLTLELTSESLNYF